MYRPGTFLLALCLLLPVTGHAWWNDSWQYRKAITIDTGELTRDFHEPVSELPVLLRLHAGNFGYFFDVNGDGSDIRFVAGDDLTPVKYYIEKFDISHEMALIWVKLPYLDNSEPQQKLWMYYGNPEATAAGDHAAVFDSHYTGIYHFGQPHGPITDFTPYGNDIVRHGHLPDPGTLVGCGLSLLGDGALALPDNPVFNDPGAGFTFSAWVKPGPGSPLTLLRRGDDTRLLSFDYDGEAVSARLENLTDDTQVATDAIPLPGGDWHHLALVIDGGEMRILVDGEVRAAAAVSLEGLGGIWTAMQVDGSTATGAQVDELRFSNIARPPEAMLAATRIEGLLSEAILYGEDEQNESGGAATSYIVDVLYAIDASGWSIIAVLAVMGIVSTLVFTLKALVLLKVDGSNAAFMNFYRQLPVRELALLAARHSRTGEQAELDRSVEGRFLGNGDYRTSTLYGVYRAALDELREMVGERALAGNRGGPVFDAGTLESLRSAMTVAWTGEYRRLKHLMVVMTVAISGAPFLGLLGTVVGVMITFAAIAATGDVNVNTIAPGIAGALATTVVGLCVAIPNLFAYNYLSGRIGHIASETSVFTEQFLSRLSRQRVQEERLSAEAPAQTGSGRPAGTAAG